MTSQHTLLRPKAGAFARELPPSWSVSLSNGEYITGQPSWLSNGRFGRLPVDAGEGVDAPSTDWRRLMARCAEDNLRITRMTLWVAGRPFRAPDNRSAYGYFEMHHASVQGSLTKHSHQHSGGGIVGVAMCWPEKNDEIGYHIKSVRIYANGVYEEWREPKWKPCMIGTKEDAL